MTQDEIYDLAAKAILKNKYESQEWFEEVAVFILQNKDKDVQLDAFKLILGHIKNGAQNISIKVKARICAKFYSDSHLLNYYFQSLPKAERDLITRITWEGVVTYGQAKTVFGHEDLVDLHNNYEGFQLKPELKRWQPFMNSIRDYHYEPGNGTILEETIRQKKITFSYPLFIREAYARILPKPDGYMLKAFLLPDSWQVSRLEQSIFEQLPNILQLKRQEVIKSTQAGYLNIPSAKSAQKKLGLKTFPNDSGYLKTLLIASFLYESKRLAAMAEPLEMIRFIFGEQKLTYTMMDALLFAYGGIRAIDTYNTDPSCLVKLLDLLRQLPEDSWIKLDNLLIYASSNYFDLDMVGENRTYALNPLFESQTAKAYKDASPRLKLKFLREQLVISIMLVAASFGLADLAYDPSDLEVQVPQKGGHNGKFSAIRLTALGAHILLGKEGYQVPDGAKPLGYELDPASLHITVDGNMKMATGLLKEWTRQVGDNLLLLDMPKIVANSKSRENLHYNIKQFLKTLGRPVPDYWKTTIMEAVYRASGLKQLQQAWVFKLSPHDRTLHSLMAQDPGLRKITLKAEDFTVVVMNPDVEQFIKKLAQLGYVVEEGFYDNPDQMQFIKEMPREADKIAAFNNL